MNLSLVLTILFSFVHFGQSFAPPSYVSFSVVQQQPALLKASLADDEFMMELDEEWQQFQEAKEQQMNQPISLNDFAAQDAPKDVEVTQSTNNNGGAVAAGVYFSVALVCLVALYYSGEAPTLVAGVDTASSVEPIVYGGMPCAM